jgi:pimeloyl-ACP methyl ester carboxylesterase
MRRFVIVLGVIAGLLGVAGLLVFGSFSSWRAAQSARLAGGSKIAQTAKGPIEYALSGHGKHTILFVHGTPGGYDQGARFAQATERVGPRVLRVSRPGYLRTPLATGQSPAEQADAYAALLDTLGIDKVSILGVSGGGPSAAEFAARHGDRCEALFMISAVSTPRDPKDQRPPPGFIENFFRGTDFGAWLLWSGLQRNPAGSLARVVSDPATVQRIMSKPERLAAYVALSESALVLPSQRTAGLMNDVHWFTAMPEIPLAAIRVPTLAVHGDKDTNVDISNAQAIVDKVPGATLVKIPGGDHFIGVSHPEDTFNPVSELLQRIDKQQTAVAAVAAQAAANQGASP